MGCTIAVRFLGVVAVSALLMGHSVPVAASSDNARTVRLPDGVTISLGPYARDVEKAVDAGRIQALAAGYIARNLSADAAAVLVYALRYRPGHAVEIADAAAELTRSYLAPSEAQMIFGALAAEPAMLPEVLAEAANRAGISGRLLDAILIAADLPDPDRESAATVSGDVASETGAAAVGGRNAGDIFGGSVLPESLRIGGGQAGGINTSEPSADGGAS